MDDAHSAKTASTRISSGSLAAIPGIEAGLIPPKLRDEMEFVDPDQGDWVTEEVSAEISTRLAQLEHAAFDHSEGTEISTPEWIASDLRVQGWPSGNWLRAYRSGPLEVRRAEVGEGGRVVQGSEAWIRVFKDLLKSGWNGGPTGPLTEGHLHSKVVGISVNDGLAEARLIVEALTVTDGERRQHHALWSTRWKRQTTTEISWVLESLRVHGWEQTLFNGNANEPFVDCTHSALGQNREAFDQISRGLPYWMDRIDARFGMDVVGPHGLAAGDVNGDGLDDLFYCEAGGLPNRLFVQEPDGTLTDRSAVAGIDFLEPSHSALIVDLDNDGDQDLLISSGRFVLFFENDGTARFSRRRLHSSESVARSMAAADFDLDGDLDIYVCGYFSRAGDTVGLGRPMPYHDANNGVRNLLLRNDGAWQFTDVTTDVGLDRNNHRFSYAAAWEDFDRDGDPDLYVANDFGRNNLYRNDRGTFNDIAAEAGVEDISAGMSVSWGDFDRDGWADIYVGNMFSSAGHRVAYQRQFRSDDDSSTRAFFQRHARGNTLFRNRGDGTFDDVSLAAGVTVGRWAWSSGFIDLNSDGLEDLIVANGMVTGPDDTGDL